jgi:aldehyde:ferredoxin oxidoreductase
MHYIDDALGMCAGLSSFPLKPPYHIHNYPKFIASGAGFDMDEETLTQAAKRYRTLVRANNTRRGMRRKTTSRPRTTGKNGSPSSKRSFWTPITNSRAGTNRAFPRKNRYRSWGSGLRIRRLRKKGNLFRGERTPSTATPPVKDKEV